MSSMLSVRCLEGLANAFREVEGTHPPHELRKGFSG